MKSMRISFFFNNDVHHIQGPRATLGSGLYSKKHRLCNDVGKIMANCRFEQVKNAVIKGVFS